MTKRLRTVGLGISFILCAVTTSLAMPMDMEAVRRLPAIEALVAKVKAGSTLTAADEEKLYAELQSADPVLSSLSVWALGETKNSKHARKISSARANLSGPAMAFATIAMAKLLPDWPASKKERLKNFLSDENPYLRIEAARELVDFNAAAAVDALQKILNDSASPCQSAAALVLDKSGKSHIAVVPIADDPYETVLDVLQPQNAFASHQLKAKVRDETLAASPFPQDTEILMWTWEIKRDLPTQSLEIRWIAADVAGVEKDHSIATARSEAGQAKGESILKKPTAGFPAGHYRIEIWQTGRMIYSEKFDIQNR
jgi:hypothetical protein